MFPGRLGAGACGCRRSPLSTPKPPYASDTCRKSHGARRGQSSSSCTFLPADAVPQRPDETNEPRQGDYEEEDGEEEDAELGGIEESKQELFR